MKYTCEGSAKLGRPKDGAPATGPGADYYEYLDLSFTFDLVNVHD